MRIAVEFYLDRELRELKPWSNSALYSMIVNIIKYHTRDQMRKTSTIMKNLNKLKVTDSLWLSMTVQDSFKWKRA